jgi:ABC-type bacteriocin/lantibiotic exporter with double-glycine peptidase domain
MSENKPEIKAEKLLAQAGVDTSDMTKAEQLKLTHYVQSIGYCGPASLKILLSYFGKDFEEDELARLALATHEIGTDHEGMVQAIKAIGGYVFVKENGTLAELEYFLKKEKLPVIIGWFDRDGDHYSVVVNVTDKNIIIVDPATDEPERWLDRKLFPNIWFDFVGKDNRAVSWGWYMVVTFEKKKFDIQGGFYF